MNWKKAFFRVATVALVVLVLFSIALAAEKGAGKAVSAGKVDLNTASQKELESLPGVGAATAKKIIAGRPYSSAADLSKAGISAKTIEKVTPLVAVGAVPPAAPAAAKSAPAASKEAPITKTQEPVTTTAPSSGKGMVWVNTSTKVFHREGDPWYGKTKKGSYMTEAEAIKAGYRESKEQKKKK